MKDKKNYAIWWKFNRFPIASGALYVRNFFKANSTQAVENLVKNVRNAFIKNLNSVEWMDKNTRALAVQKARDIHFHIAYPTELLDDNKLNEHYDGLSMRSDSLLHNVMQTRQFVRRNKIREFHKVINKTDWKTHSMTTAVNAYYTMLENSVRMFLFLLCVNIYLKRMSNRNFSHLDICIFVGLPAAVLQRPFFADDRWEIIIMVFSLQI